MNLDLGEFADWDIFSDLRQHVDFDISDQTTDEWELVDSHDAGTLDIDIPEAGTRSRSGGLAVPVAKRQIPQSLQQPLTRGGKPVPDFKRPRPSHIEPQPRKSLQHAVSSDRVQLTASSFASAARPPQGPPNRRGLQFNRSQMHCH